MYDQLVLEANFIHVEYQCEKLPDAQEFDGVIKGLGSWSHSASSPSPIVPG